MNNTIRQEVIRLILDAHPLFKGIFSKADLSETVDEKSIKRKYANLARKCGEYEFCVKLALSLAHQKKIAAIPDDEVGSPKYWKVVNKVDVSDMKRTEKFFKCLHTAFFNKELNYYQDISLISKTFTLYKKMDKKDLLHLMKAS